MKKMLQTIQKLIKQLIAEYYSQIFHLELLLETIYRRQTKHLAEEFPMQVKVEQTTNQPTKKQFLWDDAQTFNQNHINWTEITIIWNISQNVSSQLDDFLQRIRMRYLDDLKPDCVLRSSYTIMFILRSVFHASLG